ncbi:unnamed protein product, partial [Effrenium voratum]
GRPAEPTTQASCPNCSDLLLADSKFCRCCGHKLALDVPKEPQGQLQVQQQGQAQDGLQFLCTKYSALITRLREEVLARQQAEAESRLLESRLREESQSWEKEKERLMHEQQRLQEEISSLKSQLYGERHRAAGDICRRCGMPSTSRGEAKDRWNEDIDSSMWHQHQAQQKQHQQMMALLSEHSQLQAEQQNSQEELSTCREHLARWRRRTSELESEAMTKEQSRDDAEKRARCVQEEMRQALRSASAAKNRQKEAERVSRQEEQQARDLEERLKALRHDSRCNARRASSAERRLANTEAAEVACSHLEHEVADLKQRLRFAQDQGEEMRVCHQQAEDAEARAALRAGEARGELRASEALNQSCTARLRDVEVQLTSAREALLEAEADRSTSTGWAQRLGHELADARAKEQEARQQQAQQAHELREARRRLEQLVGGGVPTKAQEAQLASWQCTAAQGGPTPGGQLAQCKRKVLELEQACSRHEAEVAEERRARERCHAEAVRATEKLRLVRAQGEQMRDRLKVLEEAELRYPSRFPGKKGTVTPAPGRKEVRKMSRSSSVPAERPEDGATHGLRYGSESDLLPASRGAAPAPDWDSGLQGFLPTKPPERPRLERPRDRPAPTEHKESGRLSWEEQPRDAVPKASEPADFLEDLSLQALLSLPRPLPGELQ